MRRVLLLCAVVAGCRTSSAEPDLGPPPAPTVTPAPKADDINPRLLRRFKPLRPLSTPDVAEQARIELGKTLFFDARLSRNREVSCNTCHQLDHRGIDGKPTSTGVTGKHGKRNTPTVYNAAWHVAQFWDGRASTLEEQAKGPMLNPDEMGMRTPSEATEVLRAVPGYHELFAQAFPEDANPVDFDHARRAIAEFERTLTTPSRWDRYLKGDHTALSHAEVEGLKVFADVGCVQCHTGELVGGSMFQRVGVAEPWPNQADQGRYELTHLDTDRMVFKVPSLRNITQTAPYFHDGSIAKLPDAVRAMAKHQLGIELTDEEIESIVTWLGSLTGDVPVIMAPALPPDGPSSPK